MQMVINLAPVSLSNKKVNFYTCPRLTFVKKNATENAYKSISEPLDFKRFLGGMLPDPPRLFTVPYFFVRSFGHTASYRHGYLDFQMYRGGRRRGL